MSSKTERERTKQIQDKCQNLLNEMLKDDDNKYCVDCDAKGEVQFTEGIVSNRHCLYLNSLKYVRTGPRWASWNIGIFLCIRCAGLHRKLGVHISKVKSVNLDTWTPQQVVVRFRRQIHIFQFVTHIPKLTTYFASMTESAANG